MGLFYRAGGQYVYTLGGLITNKPDFRPRNWLKCAFRFDLHNLKWERLADMNVAICYPGVYESKDGNYLYTFNKGSIERLSLTLNDNWEKIRQNDRFKF